LSRFDDRAWAEVEEAAQWYEDRSPGLGDRLFDAVAVAVTGVEQFPRAGALWTGEGVAQEVRFTSVTPFRHSLYYTLEHEIVFVAFAHGAREPAYWAGRLSYT
jgi:hypothetical protein